MNYILMKLEEDGDKIMFIKYIIFFLRDYSNFSIVKFKVWY